MLTWFLIGAVSLVVLTVLITRNLLRELGETAEARIWASWDEPLFFIQPMYGTEFAAETTAQYERAIAMLKKHGNRFLDKEKHVHLWIHRATPNNPKLDFKEWREQCRVDERKYKEEFDLEKARNALAKGQLLARAQMLTTEKLPLEKRDFQKDKNGQY